jgi:hypothetical protein
MLNGIVVGDVRVSGVINDGDNGRDFLFYGAVVGTDRFLVVFERNPQELVF